MKSYNTLAEVLRNAASVVAFNAFDVAYRVELSEDNRDAAEVRVNISREGARLHTNLPLYCLPNFERWEVTFKNI